MGSSLYAFVMPGDGYFFAAVGLALLVLVLYFIGKLIDYLIERKRMH